MTGSFSSASPFHRDIFAGLIPQHDISYGCPVHPIPQPSIHPFLCSPFHCFMPTCYAPRHPAVHCSTRINVSIATHQPCRYAATRSSSNFRSHDNSELPIHYLTSQGVHLLPLLLTNQTPTHTHINLSIYLLSQPVLSGFSHSGIHQSIVLSKHILNTLYQAHKSNLPHAHSDITFTV